MHTRQRGQDDGGEDEAGVSMERSVGVRVNRAFVGR